MRMAMRAAAELAALAAELHEIAQSHVPLEFRSSFLQANPVHRALVRIQRHGIAALGQMAVPRLLRPTQQSADITFA